MRTPSNPDDDFLFDVKETASILERSTRVAYGWGNSGKITSKLIPVSGTSPQVFFSLESLLSFAEEMGIRPNMTIVEAITKDANIRKRFEGLVKGRAREVKPTFEGSATPVQNDSEGVIEQLNLRIAEKSEQIKDLQRRLDEKDAKAEMLLIAKMGTEQVLSTIEAKVHAVDPEIIFLPKREGERIVDVEVVKDSVKSFPWAYVWGAVSTITLLGIGTYLAVTYRIFG